MEDNIKNNIKNNDEIQIFNEPRCRIYMLDGEKFKTQICTVMFKLELNRETVTKTALLAEVLKQGCKRYNTPRTVTIATEEMFGAMWTIQVVQKGEVQLLAFVLETIKAVNTAETLDFLMEFIKNPLVENGEFFKTIVDKQKIVLKNNIISEKDNKKYLAKQRCLQETAKNSPLSINLNGYIEDIDALNGKILYDYFQEIVNEKRVNIIFCGDKNEKKELLKIRKYFTQVKQYPKEELKFSNQIIKEKCKSITEYSNIQQARVLLSFETGAVYGGKNYATLLVLAQILGGGGNSLLFHKIREECGLCYEIKAYNYPLTQYLFVETGVNSENKKQVGVEVLKIIEKIAENSVEIATLDEAKREINRQYSTLPDQPFAMIDFFTDEILFDKNRTLQGFLNQIDCITCNDVMKMAKRMQLKVFYTLQKKEEL